MKNVRDIMQSKNYLLRIISYTSLAASATCFASIFITGSLGAAFYASILFLIIGLATSYNKSNYYLTSVTPKNSKDTGTGITGTSHSIANPTNPANLVNPLSPHYRNK